MANHMDNGLGAVIKSLRDVVVPAVDATDPIAREQLGLAIDFLEFLRARMDLAMPQLEYEFAERVRLAQRVLAVVDADLGRDLQQVLLAAQAPSHAPRSADGLRQATNTIAEAVDSLVRQVADAQPELRMRVELAVIEGSAALLTFERSWFEPLAVDVDVGTLPHFSTCLPASAGAQAPR